jgi:hypothetical protein
MTISITVAKNHDMAISQAGRVAVFFALFQAHNFFDIVDFLISIDFRLRVCLDIHYFALEWKNTIKASHFLRKRRESKSFGGITLCKNKSALIGARRAGKLGIFQLWNSYRSRFFAVCLFCRRPLLKLCETNHCRSHI